MRSSGKPASVFGIDLEDLKAVFSLPWLLVLAFAAWSRWVYLTWPDPEDAAKKQKANVNWPYPI